jgi:hypothetical protein
MALISCPECKQQISDTAPTCPHCGFAQKATPVESSGLRQQPITIESTSKTWKLLKILSIVVFLIGVTVWSIDKSFGNLIIVVSVMIFIAAKIGRWWNNK